MPDGQERTWPVGSGPVVRSAEGSQPRIGELAYATWNQYGFDLPSPDQPDPSKPYADLALIRLDSTVPVDPAVCHFGGPIGMSTATTGSPFVVHYFGAGLLIGREPLMGSWVLPARSGLLVGASDPRMASLRGPVFSFDSGMPVVDNQGAAVGLLSHLGLPPKSDLIPVARLAPQLRRAQQKLGYSLTLQTAPFQASATPFGHDSCPFPDR
jgi:hypothetical protein